MFIIFNYRLLFLGQKNQESRLHMMRNILSNRGTMRKFGFLKDRGYQNGRQFSPINYFNPAQKDRHSLSSEDNATDIDLSKLKIDYFKDTAQLQNTPQLKHGLQKFLNGELVFGDQGVGKLPKQEEANSNNRIAQISGYIQPHKDQKLRLKGMQKGCKYVSSTSSISSPLIILYYLFSCFRMPKTDNLYEGIIGKPLNWMISFRKPTCFYLHKLEDGREAIVSDKGLMPVENEVLMKLGHVIEYFLTHTRQQTDKLMKGQEAPMPHNYYRYASVNDDLMLRSQIDCMSYDKEGKPYVFEIKSRACAPIRYDIQNYELYKDYQINSKRGTVQSFQREYYDLIRGGFLKYVMQVKIGGMDGAFIAYHNTQKIYGYEYVQLKQMALRVIGDEYNLDVAFVCISKMLVIVLNHVRQCLKQYKDDSLKIGFYADSRSRKLIVMVQVMNIDKEYVPLKQKTTELKTVMDYFSKHKQLKNPIYQFKFDFFNYLNGVRLNNPDILLTPHDTLEIKYKASPRLMVSKQEYILFLYQAYKQDQVFALHYYRGVWEMNENNPQ